MTNTLDPTVQIYPDPTELQPQRVFDPNLAYERRWRERRWSKYTKLASAILWPVAAMVWVIVLASTYSDHHQRAMEFEVRLNAVSYCSDEPDGQREQCVLQLMVEP